MIVVRAAQAPEPMATVQVGVVGGRITTGVFSARVGLTPSLFAPEAFVRIVAKNRSGQAVARVVTGEGYDEATGAIHLKSSSTPGAVQVVTLQVLAPLTRGERITLEAYDWGTDRLLAKSRPADVVADVMVGDDLD